MKIIARVKELLKDLYRVEEKLSSSSTLQDPLLFKELSQHHKYLTNLRDSVDTYDALKQEILDNKELLSLEQDPEVQDLLREQNREFSSKIEKLLIQIETLLVPPDPNDDRSVVVELRAGTGGDEAALFVGDCVSMYQKFAASMRWSCEELSANESQQGGFKEYHVVITGPNVHRYMQYEAGTHRVQRVPVTETQGRVHTSAITVAVMMEPDEEEKNEKIEEKDLRIDTYRASGAGGQHVNTTDSAVRITHIPTNIVVQCQAERSQIKNKEKAMRLLKTKIVEEKRIAQQKDISSMRSSQIGSGDRSERIRTYNFPQNRLSDHRINLTLYKLEEVMEGGLTQVIDPIIAFYHQKKVEDSGV